MSQHEQDKLNPERQTSEKTPLNEQELENVAGGYVVHLFHCPNCGWVDYLPGSGSASHCHCPECDAQLEILM